MSDARHETPASDPSEPPTGLAFEAVGRVIRHLADAYRRLGAVGGVPGLAAAAAQERFEALTLAAAALHYRARAAESGPRPPQVAVFGPTQTGKSTFVNLLLGQPAARVSPLAGFTNHPQGFWASPGAADERWAAALLPGWTRRPVSELTADEPQAFALTPVSVPAHPAGPPLPPCVVWDTPDFDSLAAHQHACGLLHVLALADVYVLVLSKEKYSDLSVWRLLGQVEPLRRPLLICVNKLDAESAEPVVSSVRQRLAEFGQTWGTVPVVNLPYVAHLAGGPTPVFDELTADPRRAVNEWLHQRAAPGERDDRPRSAGVVALLRRHWDTWLEVPHAEHAAREQWREMASLAAGRFMEAYKRDYLTHPQRYDSFRRAALELLDLLEIPRIGSIMARARQVLTWPARQLVAVGRAWWRERQTPAGRVHSLGVEATVLTDALASLLTGLRRDVARRAARREPAAAFWQALEQALAANQERWQTDFDTALRAHHEHVTREIRLAAHSLYAELKQQPGRLAALRTARATLDVGAIILAVKTGGLSALDAVFAPAAFTLASLLMEGLTGLEMRRVDRALRARQYEAVEQQLMRGLIVAALEESADKLDDARLCALAPELVEQATRALHTLEVQHG